MDFSRFVTVVNEQTAAFKEVKKNMDAKGYDAICLKINDTLSEISLVASVVPVESRKDLITILKSIRALALGLQELLKQFDGPAQTVAAEPVPEASTPIEPITPTPIEDVPAGNEPSQSESQTLEKGNAKTLTLINPSIPNGNVFGQFNQAA